MGLQLRIAWPNKENEGRKQKRRRRKANEYIVLAKFFSIRSLTWFLVASRFARPLSVCAAKLMRPIPEQ
ncbi:autophagy-related protein 18c-like [Gossypium australe]|uniref:Autophagy-related protein 18c-like n=1 Tax=Gossypium australe TaxID=47621 RepID=A0A5B6U6R0_9ROSI|nr:autophagy-related protein 18c-like [Gossypium australe]